MLPLICEIVGGNNMGLIQLINMDDFESLPFPNLDEKRKFIDLMLAGEINELKLKRPSKFWPLIVSGMFISIVGLIFPYSLLVGFVIGGAILILVGCVEAIIE